MPMRSWLMDIEIRLYRQAPEVPAADGERPSLESRLIATDYAARWDQRVSDGELGALQTFTTQRRYVVRRDEMYTLPADADLETLGENPLGDDPLGEALPRRPAIARDGSNARAGLLLEDTETGEFFNVSGVTYLLNDNTKQVIHCVKTRGRG